MIQIQEFDKQDEDGNAKLFYDTYIDKVIVDNVLDIINKYDFYDESSFSTTVNGLQTSNIIDLFSEKILKDIIPINDFYKSLFHLHYINYRHGGSQKKHDHSKTEKYSFILYLNDADGDTVFESPINKNITPRKGRLVVFSSDIIHYGLETYKNKKLLVGAITQRNS